MPHAMTFKRRKQLEQRKSKRSMMPSRSVSPRTGTTLTAHMAHKSHSSGAINNPSISHELCLTHPPSLRRVCAPFDSDVPQVHPINHLPTELLVEIFRRCTGDAEDNPYCAPLRTNLAPLVLASVCKAWRDIASDVHQLWQYFILQPCQGRSHFRIAWAFLARTKGRGMHVNYREYSDNGTLVDEKCPCALDFVLQNIGHLRSLCLINIGEKTAQRLAQVASGSATSMERLYITGVHWNNPTPATAGSLSALCSSTSLRRLVCVLPAFPENTAWSQLTSLTLARCDPQLFLRIIATARRLKSFATFIPAYQLNPWPLHLVTSSNSALEQLQFRGEGPQDQLFRALRLPGLRRLVLSPPVDRPFDHRFSWPFDDTDSLSDFIDHLRDGLDQLHLIQVRSTFALAWMPQTTSLRMLHLTVPVGEDGDPFFKALTVEPDDSSPLLPRLLILEFGHCVTTDGLISRVLLSRRRLPLRIVSLRYDRKTMMGRSNDKDVAKFGKMNRAGWQITWDIVSEWM